MEVAIKSINFSENKEENMKSLQNEVQLLSTFRHPNSNLIYLI